MSCRFRNGRRYTGGSWWKRATALARQTAEQRASQMEATAASVIAGEPSPAAAPKPAARAD